MGHPTTQGRGWFLAGLFLATLATLGLEMLDTRLLSVLTWYHLSFFAVSIAMFGMSAAAVHVFLAGEKLQGAEARQALAHVSVLFAISIPLSHIGNLCIPFELDPSLTAVAGVVFGTLVLAVPFYLAGFLVTIALTRVGGQIGLTYATDLLGASLGSLLVIPLLHWFNISSSVFAVAGFAALAAYCFQRYAGTGRRLLALGLALALFVAAFANSVTHHGLRVLFSKSEVLKTEVIQHEAWTTHSQVIARKPKTGPPFYWSARPPQNIRVETVGLVIDGDAFTGVTRWDGQPASLAWVQYDLTTLPYHLRQGGDAAVIGSGGGRDILAALWGQSASVTGIEINGAILNLLRGPLRDFARLADCDKVTLVHDEARSFLTRQKNRYDVLQMSLVDTWAATGAGAFTLSENGLYTREGWKVFLEALKPGGLLSVSRWHDPAHPAETARLLALGTAGLLDRGITRPADHMALVSHDTIVTLLSSPAPLTEDDLRRLKEVAGTYRFTILVAPGQPPATPRLRDIAASDSHEALAQATQADLFDFSPPTDQRPYFFNSLKPGSLLKGDVFDSGLWNSLGTTARGNMLATITLVLLGVTALVLVATIILGPLWRAGLPRMDRWGFFHAVLYFAIIGLGFMLVQIPYMQRFSVYLGHPTYAVAVILFSMICFTGVGSFCSDRLAIETRPGWLFAVPLAIALAILAVTLAAQPVIDATVQLNLVPRCLVVVGLTAPVAALLGFCFPIGMRLVGRISTDATAWMWGVNGACGVLASVLAVVLSLWVGIHSNLYVAAALYAVLLLPAHALWRKGTRLA